MQDTHFNSFSIFHSVIDMEVAKTATSFLTCWNYFNIVAFLFIGVTLNMV